MASKVFFTDARSRMGKSLLRKLRNVLRAADIAGLIGERDMVAVKVHWGEAENTAYLRPPFVRTVVEAVRQAGGRPFVTDTNVLYRAMRHDALGNLEAAAMNGFTRETLGAPVIVADGLRGRDGVDVDVPGGVRVKTARIASAVHHADALVVLSHVKGHLLFGYGGALKSLGMGCATPAGKCVLHQDLNPSVDQDKCVGCRMCFTVCPEDAIDFQPPPPGHPVGKKVSHIDPERCIGCGECVAACPEEAIPVVWETAQPPLLEKTAEYALAAVSNKRDKVGFVNFLFDVVPDCDCANWTDPPVVPNLGMLASNDPVAVDQASLDLINRAPILPGSALEGRNGQGDPFLAIHKRDYRGILEHAERIGLGSRTYELAEVR